MNFSDDGKLPSETILIIISAILGVYVRYKSFRSRAKKLLYTILIEVPPIKMGGDHY